VPPPRNEEDELSGEPWYTVGPHDIFPETYGPFLLGDPRVRAVFIKHHADFFDPALWQASKDKLLQGELPDFYPYDTSLRFCMRYPDRFTARAGDQRDGESESSAQRAA
jgi:isocitrate dehydrogenase kinase/phosphatase